MSKQESMSDWWEMAKAYEKAEKETVMPYVFVRIEDRTNHEQLRTFDVSRNAYEKNLWFFRWKTAECQCERPKNNVIMTLTFYDKKTGLDMGFGSLLSKITSSKAQITILEKKIEEYKRQMCFDLFFDEQNDPVLAKAKEKLSQKKNNLAELQKELEEKVKEKGVFLSWLEKQNTKSSAPV